MLARRASAFEAVDGRGLRHIQGFNLVFGGGRLELFELQLQLVDQPGSAFRAVAKLLSPEFGESSFRCLIIAFEVETTAQIYASSLPAASARGSEAASAAYSLAISVAASGMAKAYRASKYTPKNMGLEAAYPAFFVLKLTFS
jgi:hypothetical protein